MSEIRTNIKKTHSFYEFFLSNEQINTDTLYIIPGLEKRKNLKNLEFYRDLHKNKIIKNKKFKKDNLDNIYKKIDNYENKNLNISYPKFKKNLHIFSENIFEIEKPADFFDLAKKHFKYIVIQQNYITKNTNNELTPGLTEYVKNNLILIKNLFNQNQIEEEEIEFNFTFRKLFILKLNYSRNEKKKNESSKLVFGNNYSLYKFN